MPMWKLTPACKDYLWGGEKLREKYHIESDCEPLAEAWMLSCHPDGMSRLAEGEMKGLTLPEAALKYPGNFFGTRCAEFEEFPMLVKLIDAKRDLSVQVHPDDEYARREEHQSGKAEMWMVLETEPGAALYYGFARAVSRDEIEKSLAENTLIDLLRRVPVQPGDVFYIPPGTVHAIGAGMVIAEIQQSSNVTYRLYDYGRLGADGKPRPLHVERSLAVLKPGPVEQDWDLPFQKELLKPIKGRSLLSPKKALGQPLLSPSRSKFSISHRLLTAESTRLYKQAFSFYDTESVPG